VYDYVVVGAGSSGCVLASRLTEDPSVRVLLLEAGAAPPRLRSSVPAAFSRMFKTKYDWGETTTPQRQLDGRRLYWPRGRMLGGSSSLNAMVYIRGNRSDYDGWAQGGATGWGYADVLPYFLRSEDNSRGPNRFHATGGPLAVGDVDAHPLSEAFCLAGRAAGLPSNDDFNGPTQEGLGYYQATVRNGRRASSATAFLGPALGRPNLTVVTGLEADRVVLKGGRAVAVVASRGSTCRTYRAAREVLIAAGTVGSAALLLRSGIGEPQQLERAGVRVMHELPPVGRHQPVIGLGWFVSGVRTMDFAGSVGDLARYLCWRSGPLASHVVEAGGFVSTSATTPDLQLHVAPALFIDHGLTRPSAPGMSLGVSLVSPRSEGSVSLVAGSGRRTEVQIEPNYLAEPDDLDRLVEGLQLLLEIADQQPLRPLLGDMYEIERTDRQELRSWTAAKAESLYHPTGTCAISRVVDPQLRVLGLDGLRVCDASVMPGSPTGNTHAPTVMIAERAADLLSSSPTTTLRPEPDIERSVVAALR
jgi:choline dehydrogenase